MLYLQFDPNFSQNLNFRSPNRLWTDLSSFRQFSSPVDQALSRLIKLNERFDVVISESDLVDILNENNDATILDFFSSTTWALFHVAYDRCLDKSQKKLFSTIKTLFDSTSDKMPCCLFLLSQFDFDIDQNSYVSDAILSSQDAWAQLTLLSLPEFDMTLVNTAFLRDRLIQVLNTHLCEFIELTYILSIRRHDAEKLLNNIINLGLNEKITLCSQEVIESLVNLGEVAQHETGPIQAFFTTLTTFNEYTLENISFAVKKLLHQAFFNVKRYYDKSSEAFKKLPEAIQAMWLENWFSLDDIETLKTLSNGLQKNPEILRDPITFVNRLVQKYLPILMQSLSVDEDIDLSRQQLIDYRIRKIFQLTLSLENPYKNEVIASKAFVGVFLWHQITFYQQVKEQREGNFKVVGQKKRNEKIDFLRHIFRNLSDIVAGGQRDRIWFMVNYYHNSRIVEEFSEYQNKIQHWVEGVILYNSDKSKGSHAAKILACLPDQYLRNIFNVTLHSDDLREKAFPGKNFRTAEACLVDMFSGGFREQDARFQLGSLSWSNTSSAASSRVTTPEPSIDEEEELPASLFSSRVLQSFKLLVTPTSSRPPSRQSLYEGLSSNMLFQPIGIADTTPSSVATTLPDESTPGFSEEEIIMHHSEAAMLAERQNKPCQEDAYILLRLRNCKMTCELQLETDKMNVAHWLICNFKKIKNNEYPCPMRQVYDMYGPDKDRVSDIARVEIWLRKMILSKNKRGWLYEPRSEMAEAFVLFSDKLLNNVFKGTNITLLEIWNAAFPGRICNTEAERKAAREALVLPDIEDVNNVSTCEVNFNAFFQNQFRRVISKSKGLARSM